MIDSKVELEATRAEAVDAKHVDESLFCTSVFESALFLCCDGKTFGNCQK